jgi:hypothetical protein
MQPDATMTLRDGLEEYYGTIEDLITDQNAPADVAALFHFHDVCHVVFGCDTSASGEALVDTWAFFGSTVTFETYQRYASLPQTKSIFAAMSLTEILRMMGESTTAIPIAFWRARTMRRKWPFEDPGPYMDRPLDEIRRELGIEVVV